MSVYWLGLGLEESNFCYYGMRDPCKRTDTWYFIQLFVEQLKGSMYISTELIYFSKSREMSRNYSAYLFWENFTTTCNRVCFGDTSRLSCEPHGIPQKGLHRMCSNELLRQRNVQISFTVENKWRSHNNDVHDSVSPNVDSLSIKLKHNVLEE